LSGSEPEVGLENSALIVWDMQNGISRRAFNIAEIIPNVNLLIEAAHRSRRPVIASQHTGLAYEYLSKYGIYSARRRGMDPKAGVFMAEGSPEWRLIDELVLGKEDVVVRKHTPSFFVGTMVEQLLRNRGVDAVILTGVSTDAGIEGTARHAAALGFIPVVVEDAVGSFDRARHESALQLMRGMFPVRKTEDVMKSLRNLG
jgi:nicotinamidase-related amidase